MDRRYALRVTTAYAIFAGAWIALSDGMLSRLGLTAAQISSLSLAKGLGFVAVTSVVLYVSVMRGTRRFAALSDRLSTFIDVAPIPIISIDVDQNVVLWNPAAEKVFGWSAEEVLGMPLPIVDPGDWDEFVEIQRRLPDGAIPAGLSATRRRRDGALVKLRVFNAAVRDERGRVVGTIGVLEDVTDYDAAIAELERYRDHLAELVEERTAELRRSNAELKRATEAKDTFLASMSHELRTPLNSIIGFTQIMLQGLAGPLNDEQSRQVGMVNAAGRHLLALINDVLDLSKIEAGQTSIHAERVRIADIIEAVEGTVRPLLDAKALSWTCEGLETPDVTMFTDRRRVEQILLNLLSNAVKFTEHGGVRLSVSVSGPFVRFEVADTGVGIAEDALHRVFGEFVQIETPDAIRPEGTGLGLAISLRLARLLGGTLVAASQPGVGSTFVLTLPVGAEGFVSADRGNKGRTVLVVDDDMHARTIVATILTDAGYVVRQAADGAAALEAVRADPPDAILLDLVMPRIDGWGVLEKLKADPETADIPTICVSILLESEHAPVEGFAGYLVKPIDPAGMLGMLHTILAGSESDASDARKETS